MVQIGLGILQKEAYFFFCSAPNVSKIFLIGIRIWDAGEVEEGMLNWKKTLGAKQSWKAFTGDITECKKG